MPLGDIGFDRYNSFIDSDKTKELIESNFSLIKIPLSTGGPARLLGKLRVPIP